MLWGFTFWMLCRRLQINSSCLVVPNLPEGKNLLQSHGAFKSMMSICTMENMIFMVRISFRYPFSPWGHTKNESIMYSAAKDEVPFESVKLVQTPLATYLLVDWNSEKYFFVELIDESGQPLEPKGSISMNSYAMEDLPDRIYLSVSDPDTEQTERVEAVYVQDETVSRGRE